MVAQGSKQNDEAPDLVKDASGQVDDALHTVEHVVNGYAVHMANRDVHVRDIVRWESAYQQYRAEAERDVRDALLASMPLADDVRQKVSFVGVSG